MDLKYNQIDGRRNNLGAVLLYCVCVRAEVVRAEQACQAGCRRRTWRPWYERPKPRRRPKLAGPRPAAPRVPSSSATRTGMPTPRLPLTIRTRSAPFVSLSSKWTQIAGTCSMQRGKLTILFMYNPLTCTLVSWGTSVTSASPATTSKKA